MTQTRSEWLAERRTGIGGSDVAAILGISKWRTPLDVYKDKIGELPETPDNASMDWGRRLEPVIRQAYSDTTGRPVSVPSQMIRSAQHDFMCANLDGIAGDRILEIKTARSAKEWGEPGSDEIPDYYKTQVQHYMTVTGLEVSDVAVLIGASDFRIYTVENDKELAELIVEREAEFWKMVQDRTPPEPRTSKEALEFFPMSKDQGIEATTQIAKMCEDYKAIEAEIKDLEAKLATTRDGICCFMKDAAELTFDGTTIAAWKSSKPRTVIDTKAFAKEEPQLYVKYSHLSAPSRRFLVK